MVNKMKNTKIEHTVGSGNIFADLGFHDAEERLAKATLATRIEMIITKRKLKQTQAAKILGITQSKISALKNGKLSGFSMEKLIYYLNLLNEDVEIVIKTHSGRKHQRLGCLTVAFA